MKFRSGRQLGRSHENGSGRGDVNSGAMRRDEPAISQRGHFSSGGVGEANEEASLDCASHKRKPRPRDRAHLICGHCAVALNKSVYAQGRTIKSCPKCSLNDGGQHIFYPYPQAFGASSTKVTPQTPEGGHSYCTACRNRKPQMFGSWRCSDTEASAEMPDAQR